MERWVVCRSTTANWQTQTWAPSLHSVLRATVTLVISLPMGRLLSSWGDQGKERNRCERSLARHCEDWGMGSQASGGRELWARGGWVTCLYLQELRLLLPPGVSCQGCASVGPLPSCRLSPCHEHFLGWLCSLARRIWVCLSLPASHGQTSPQAEAGCACPAPGP